MVAGWSRRPREFTSRVDFWLEDIRRWRSPEAGYGVMWTQAGRLWPTWRVSYIRVTGEVYAERLAAPQGLTDDPGSAIRLLGVVPPDPVPHGRELDLTYYRTLDKVLKGWADPRVSRMDLAWVTSRLNGYAEHAAPPLEHM